MKEFLSAWDAFNNPDSPWYYVVALAFLVLIFAALAIYIVYAKKHKKPDGSDSDAQTENNDGVETSGEGETGEAEIKDGNSDSAEVTAAEHAEETTDTAEHAEPETAKEEAEEKAEPTESADESKSAEINNADENNTAEEKAETEAEVKPEKQTTAKKSTAKKSTVDGAKTTAAKSADAKASSKASAKTSGAKSADTVKEEKAKSEEEPTAAKAAKPAASKTAASKTTGTKTAAAKKKAAGKPFIDRLIEEKSVHSIYNEIKNTILSYPGIKAKLDKDGERFVFGEEKKAAIALDGGTIKLNLYVDPTTVPEQFGVKDVGGELPTELDVTEDKIDGAQKLIFFAMNVAMLTRNSSRRYVDYVQNAINAKNRAKKK